MRLSDDDESDGAVPDEFDDDGGLDREFPIGDGTADTEARVMCPYCAEVVEIAVDPGGGAVQEYVEDCQVCCQPWRVTVTYGDDGHAECSVQALDD